MAHSTSKLANEIVAKFIKLFCVISLLSVVLVKYTVSTSKAYNKIQKAFDLKRNNVALWAIIHCYKIGPILIFSDWLRLIFPSQNLLAVSTINMLYAVISAGVLSDSSEKIQIFCCVAIYYQYIKFSHYCITCNATTGTFDVKFFGYSLTFGFLTYS